MTQPMKLVPAEPTEEMIEAGWCATGEFDQRYMAALAASPHAGQVSRGLREQAAMRFYEANGGADEIDWEDAPEPQKSWCYEQVDAVFAVLGLQVEEE